MHVSFGLVLVAANVDATQTPPVGRPHTPHLIAVVVIGVGIVSVVAVVIAERKDTKRKVSIMVAAMITPVEIPATTAKTASSAKRPHTAIGLKTWRNGAPPRRATAEGPSATAVADRQTGPSTTTNRRSAAAPATACAVVPSNALSMAMDEAASAATAKTPNTDLRMKIVLRCPSSH